uniref:Calpain catalytic domain-containing protein n=1 Tax=Syphacia muris TaxID=451379 RepID=A0A0N5AUF7_9BILA
MNISNSGTQRKAKEHKYFQNFLDDGCSDGLRAECGRNANVGHQLPSTSAAFASVDNLKKKLCKINIKDVTSSVGSALNISRARDRFRVYRQPQAKVLRQPRSQSSPNFSQMPSSSNTDKLYISESSGKLQEYDEENARKEFQRIEGFCSSCGIPFIDDSFPHSIRSLGNLSRVRNEGVLCEINAKDLVWLRPQEMFTKDGRQYHWTVFCDPKPTDIEQGALGNCWFLSALAVIAERPDILEKIVLTKLYNPVGVYQIRLCVDGKWQHVVLDDFFPCRKRSRTLAFAVGRRNQLWVPLIEKAFAKITGNYAKLLAGRVLEGLAVLTGSPCSLIDLEEAHTAEARNVLWAKLLSMRLDEYIFIPIICITNIKCHFLNTMRCSTSAFWHVEANFLMGCSCGAGKRLVDKDAYLSRGLQPRHAYSILDVKEYRGCSRLSIRLSWFFDRLVRLRNPWGAFVWKGDWSDNWSGWNDHSRAVLLPNGFESGAFWMPYDQFLRHFDSVEVARIRSFSGWKELHISFTITPAWGKAAISWVTLKMLLLLKIAFPKAFLIHVENSTEIAVTFHQKGGREETDADLMVLVHEIRASDRVGKLVARSSRKMAAFVATDDFFLKGGKEYFLIPCSLSNINEGKVLETVVVIHSAKPLLLEQVRLPSIAVTDSLVQFALKEGKQRVSLPGVVSRFVSTDFDGHILMYDNLHERNYLQVCCDCSASMNVISTRSTLRTIDSIPPSHRQIVMILSHLEASQGHSLHHDLTERLTSSKELQDWANFFALAEVTATKSEHVPVLGTSPGDILHMLRPI